MLFLVVTPLYYESVGYGRHDLNMEMSGVMGSHQNAVGLTNRSHLDPFGQTTAHLDEIELHILWFRLSNKLVALVEALVVLTGCQWYGDATGQLAQIAVPIVAISLS